MLFHEKLLNIVSQVTGIPESDIISKSRMRNVTNAKQLFGYFLRTRFDLKLKQIGSIMLNDHTSVIHCIKVINNMIDIKDERTLGYISEIDACIINLEGLNFVRKIKINVPTDCDIDRLKLVLIEEFGCSIEFVFE